MLDDFNRCKICGEWAWLSSHSCKPRWQIIRKDYDEEDDYENAYGHDAENAAIKYVEENFSYWEYPEDIEVWIRKTEDDQWEKFAIYVESVPSFSAERIE